ncbi:MAG: nucleoside kinase [Spirochaetes bacterium]|nr:MAG: nucleoside kinase [Spirochaetota bacterium]
MREITVTLPSGKSRVVPYGTKVNEFMDEPDFKETKYPIVGALVNNELVSLSFKVEINSHLKPVPLNTRNGARIYRRSLCFLLTIASRDIFPEWRLVISHSMGNGYYFYFDNVPNIGDEDIERLSRRMRELVEEGLPINRRVISYTEALEHFNRMNQLDTALLLKHTNENKVPVNICRDFMDIFHEPLVPNTNILKYFELKNYHIGFILRYPAVGNPYTIPPFRDNPILFSIYQEYKNWGKILKVNSVGRLNEIVENKEIQEFIRVAEALHNKKIAEIADRIHERKDTVRLVLIAGPSSSGKTTFTKKLFIQLRVLGFNPVVISMDDYFVPRELTPRDENGRYDFESIKAIDTELLNQHLSELLKGREVIIPDYDFKTGKRKLEGKPLKLSDQSLIIMEGIHGLNCNLTPQIDMDKKYKIYVSALTQLNLDDHNRISTTDNRLLRRLVRDYKFRGYSALETLSRWPSVRDGENKYIFPYQNNADSAFNSALDYELSVLTIYAIPLLRTIKPFHEHYTEAKRLETFLNNFAPIPAHYVPRDSILREFIGESEFKY